MNEVAGRLVVWCLVTSNTRPPDTRPPVTFRFAQPGRCHLCRAPLPRTAGLHFLLCNFAECAHLSRLFMSDREQIETIRSLTLAQLVDLRANPKPTYSIDGQTISWTSYIQSLQQTVDWCDAKLIGLAPFEVQSRGTT